MIRSAISNVPSRGKKSCENSEIKAIDKKIVSCIFFS